MGAMIDIDQRVSAQEFMDLLKCKKSKFYNCIKNGTIKKPHTDNGRLTFWYASYVKTVVENQNKDNE